MLRKAIFILFLALNVAGVAHAGLFSDDVAHKKIADMQQQVQLLEARIAKLEQAIQNQGLVDLLTQVESLKGEVTKMRGDMEVQAHDIESTQKRQKDLYVDLDTRLRTLEQPGAVGGATPSVTPSVDAAMSKNPTVSLPADPASEARSYDAALNLFKSGSYKNAIAAFQNFLKNYPNSHFASAAQYWTGNAYFALRDFKTAMSTQQKLLANFPDSSKAPDAMLNIASSQIELNQTAAAKRTLEDLVARYPVSSAAELAQKRLASLR